MNAYFVSALDRWLYVLPTDITNLLRTVACRSPSDSGFAPTDVSARSTRAGGAMAMLCAAIDSDRIRLTGQWRSDEMYRYLHVQAQPVMSGVAAAMLCGGDFRLNLPALPAAVVPSPPASGPTLALAFGYHWLVPAHRPERGKPAYDHHARERAALPVA